MGDAWMTRQAGATCDVWVGPTEHGGAPEEPRVYVVVVAVTKPRPGKTSGVYTIDSVWSDEDAARARAADAATENDHEGAWVEAWSVRSPEVLFARAVV
jgi:hypothetical protein